MKAQEFFINKKTNNVLKGIALILMFCHHFLGFGDWRIRGNDWMSIIPQYPVIEYNFSTFGKICVSIFAFLTGYALFIKNDEYRRFSYRFKKIVKILLDYWVIELLFLIVGIVLKDNLPSLENLFFNMFGMEVSMDTTINGFIQIPFAGYLIFYIYSILFYPLMISQLKYDLFTDSIIAIFGLYVFYYVANFIGITKYAYYFFTYMTEYGPVLLAGFLFAKYNIFFYINDFFNRCKINNILVYVVLLIFTFFYTIKYSLLNDFFYLSVIQVPLFIYFTIGLLKFIKWRLMEKVLVLIGRHSLNLWFLHALFFTPRRTFQWIAYIPKVSFIIIIWVILLLLPLSFLITKVQNNLWKCVYGGILKIYPKEENVL